MRKLRHTDDLTNADQTQEEIAELEMTAATLYDWHRQYGGMDTDAGKKLREQNSRLERLLADTELEKDVLREVAK